jgi:hypothetical protein
LVMPVSAEDLSVFMLDNANSAFLTLVETANEDIVVINADYNITYVGKRLIDKIGKPVISHINIHIFILSFVHPINHFKELDSIFRFIFICH